MMAVPELCARCIAAMEPLPGGRTLLPVPDGCCAVCWERYGRYIPICRTGGEIWGRKERKIDET